MREEGITRLAPRLQGDRAKDAIARLWRFFEPTLKKEAQRTSRYSDKQDVDCDAIATDAILSYVGHLQEASTNQLPSSRSSMRSTLIRRVWKRVKREQRHYRRFRSGAPAEVDAAVDGNPPHDYDVAKSHLLDELRPLLKPREYEAYVLRLAPMPTDQIANKLQRSRRSVQRQLKHVEQVVKNLCEDRNA